MTSFWEQLDKPIVGLAPMDGVTDAAFRYMVGKYGRPSVMFTEFVSVDALHYAKGVKRERLLKTLVYQEIERPIVAQVFGKTPELFAEAAELLEQLGFDGVDINMGCPVRKVSEHGAGAGLIRTPRLAQELVRVVKAATKLPVSVKTRLGVEEKEEMEEWIEALLEVEPVVISLHGRTLRQMYTGRADWEAIGKAGELVHRRGGMILGNGDVESVQDVKLKAQNHGVDGVLIGRGALGNPVFAKAVAGEAGVEQRLSWILEHAKKHEEIFGADNFLPCRKHLAWYARGFPGAGELRQELVKCSGAGEVARVLRSFRD